MEFIERMKERARTSIKTIVLPESDDIRVLKGAEIVKKEGFANVILIGDDENIKRIAEENSINIEGIEIVNPETHAKTTEYINYLFELRKEKGMTLDQAEKLIKENSRYFATMMVKMGDADGFVSGANHPTADTLKPALQVIKGREGVKTISAFFIMCLPEKQFGDDGVYIYADCGMNSNPDSEQLSDIAITSAESYNELVNENGIPRVAMLSYSTKGSAHSELVDKVVDATNLVKSKKPDLLVDGELQLDAAILDDIATMKAPGSEVAGKANILIFPNLDAGNIGYKLTQRFGHAEAYGPLCQGLDKPVNDLSRGCSAEDVAGIVAITSVQAQRRYCSYLHSALRWSRR